MTREEFRARWQAHRDLFKGFDATVPAAGLCDALLADFDVVCQTEDTTLCALEEASIFSGYSSDHLRRLARDGKLPAVRRGRRLFFRKADLPKKPRTIDSSRATGYDPIADARRVATRTSLGGTDG